MSDTEIFEMEKPKAEKKPRKKKVITEQEKQALVERLKIGRATALANRQKKALEKKIDREAEEKARDEKIAKHVLKKNPVDDNLAELKAELKELRAELKEMKKAKEPEKVEQIKIQIEEKKEEIEEVKVVEKKVDFDEEPEVIEKPIESAPIPIPIPKRKVFNTKLGKFVYR